MLKVNIKTIKQKDQVDDIKLKYRDIYKNKSATFGEYTVLLKFTIDKLKDYNTDIVKLVKMFMEVE